MADNASKKPLWPKTPQGTTDWEAVFEDPKTGLIAAVSGGKSAAALKQSTTLIIQKLFTRDGDEEEVKRFLADLEAITANVESDEQLSATLQAVVGLMRQIKEGRQQKAHEYLAARKRGQQSSERRTKKKKKSGSSWVLQALLAASNPKIALPIIVVIIAVVGGAAYFLAQPDIKVDLAAKQSPPQVQAEVTKPALKTSKEVAPKPDGKAEAERSGQVKKNSWPRAVLLQAVNWPMLRKISTQRQIPYAMLLYIKSNEALSAICLSYPYVMESFLLAFAAVRPDSEQPVGKDFSIIGKLAQKRINKRVGPAVEFIEIYRYGDPKYLITTIPPCRLAR